MTSLGSLFQGSFQNPELGEQRDGRYLCSAGDIKDILDRNNLTRTAESCVG